MSMYTYSKGTAIKTTPLTPGGAYKTNTAFGKATPFGVTTSHVQNLSSGGNAKVKNTMGGNVY